MTTPEELPPFVSVEAFLQRLHPDVRPTADPGQIAALLDDASTLVRAATGTRWATPEGMLAGVPPIVALTAYQCARRAFDNPSGQAEVLGAASFQQPTPFSGGRIMYGLFLTEEEEAVLQREAARGDDAPPRKTGLFTIRTERDDAVEVHLTQVSSAAVPWDVLYADPVPFEGPDGDRRGVGLFW